MGWLLRTDASDTDTTPLTDRSIWTATGSADDTTEELILLPVDDGESGGPGGDAAADQRSPEQVAVVRELVDAVRHWCLVHRPEPSSFPAMASRVITFAEDPDADPGELVNLLQQDAAISAKLLGIANSAALHRGTRISSVRQAAAHLGMQAITQIAIGVACRSLYDSGSREELELYRGRWSAMFMDSMTVAYSASQFSVERGLGHFDQLFLGGLLHDVGKVLALQGIAALTLGGAVAPLDAGLLEQVLEQVHVEVGVEAMQAWCLPPPLVTMCRCHHDAQVPACEEAVDLHVLRVVCGLQELGSAPALDRTLVRQVRDSAAALALDGDALGALEDSVAMTAERVAQVFSTNH